MLWSIQRRLFQLGLLVASGGLVLGCVTRPIDQPNLGSGRATQTTFPQTLEKDVDILFVIDDSPSMKEEQINLQNNFKALIEALRNHKLGPAPGSTEPCDEAHSAGCSIPNVHIGVISPNLGAGLFTSQNSCGASPTGDGGRLQNAPRQPGCTPPTDPWISYVEGQSNVAGSGDHIERVKDAFSCIAALGDEGCGFERQLDAARIALDPNENTNPGFLRPEAFLAIVFITDEDDCSVLPGKEAFFNPFDPALGPVNFRCFEYGAACQGVAPADERKPGDRTSCVPSSTWMIPPTASGGNASVDFESFFKGLRPRGRVIVSALAGPPTPVSVIEVRNPLGELEARVEPSCIRTGATEPETAFPAIRIKALTDAFQGASGDIPGQFNPICTDNFGPALEELGEIIIGALGRQCITAPLLLPSGGLACAANGDLGGGHSCTAEGCLNQVDCEIEEVVGFPNEQRTPIARCTPELFANPDVKDCGSNCPCWRIIDNGKCNADEDGTPYALEILREGGIEPAKGTVAEARCSTSLAKWGSSELFESLASGRDGQELRICR